jgi:hypothetical protein
VPHQLVVRDSTTARSGKGAHALGPASTAR